jgi:hypothetical protein
MVKLNDCANNTPGFVSHLGLLPHPGLVSLVFSHLDLVLEGQPLDGGLADAGAAGLVHVAEGEVRRLLLGDGQLREVVDVHLPGHAVRVRHLREDVQLQMHRRGFYFFHGLCSMVSLGHLLLWWGMSWIGPLCA